MQNCLYFMNNGNSYRKNWRARCRVIHNFRAFSIVNVYNLSDFLKINVQIELFLCITLWKLWITITENYSKHMDKRIHL